MSRSRYCGSGRSLSERVGMRMQTPEMRFRALLAEKTSRSVLEHAEFLAFGEIQMPHLATCADSLAGLEGLALCEGKLNIVCPSANKTSPLPICSLDRVPSNRRPGRPKIQAKAYSLRGKLRPNR
jgi:hypothetical protein